MRTKLYVSMDSLNRGTVIRRGSDPKDSSELPIGGIYAIGPFRSRAAADICASGRHPYSMQTVCEFERYSRRMAAH